MAIAVCSTLRSLLLAGLVACDSVPATAADQPKPGVVSHVKVLSDKVLDVSSFAAWKKSYITEGMSEHEKALAIWKSIVTHQHQDAPPYEFLQHEGLVLDAMKVFNVYGYSFCGVAASHTQAFARFLGMKARGWTVTNHVVPEVMVDGKWRLIDSSMIQYFLLPDKTLAGVEEIEADLKAWFGKNPGYLGEDKKLREFMRGGNWRTNGPPIVATSQFLSDNGWSLSNCHGWYSVMEEYNGKHLTEYELGCSQGYQVNIQLREGERLARNWSHKGLVVNGNQPEALAPIDGSTLGYSRSFGDLSNHRVGNGTHEYTLPLASGAFRGGMLVADNLAATAEDKKQPAVHAKDASKPAVLVFRMPSSYIYLGGRLSFTPVVGANGSVAVSFSDNNGLDWKPVATAKQSGPQVIDLKSFTQCRYDYRLKIELTGAGTGLDALAVTHDIQHSQRPLPALGQGDNTISFSSASQEGTVTVEGGTNTGDRDKQVLITDFHPKIDGMEMTGMIDVPGPTGTLTIPIEAPADIVRLRFGCHYRARAENDAFDLQVSYDDGKTFTTAERATGPGSRLDKWITVTDVPKGTRKALVRYAGTKSNALCMFNIRIDADYIEPQGGFRPIKVTYAWQENGQAKTDVHVAKKASDSWTITCPTKPVMGSIVLELE
ncbi:MAG: hypothetical protein H0V44_18455 [Planctomycetes bacterium]|nr:hypothetical protein [Planctomycetota bacterium]